METPKRRPVKKRLDPRISILVAVCAVILIALIVMACSLSGGKKDDISSPGQTGSVRLPALSVDMVTPVEDDMVITTSYGQMCYPYMFSDLIACRAENGKGYSALNFFMVLKGEEYPVFSIYFNKSQGYALGTMVLPGMDEPVPVYGALAEAPELDSDGAKSFAVAQECFNDIVFSLAENEGFQTN